MRITIDPTELQPGDRFELTVERRAFKSATVKRDVSVVAPCIIW